MALAIRVGNDPTILSAITKQNSSGVSLKEIQEIDRNWINDKEFRLRRQRTNNDCAKRLKRLIRNDSMLVEAFIMDNQGAVVCASDETSDYWQGDEAKWQKTFAAGKKKLVERPKLDESTQVFAAQYSTLIKDKKRKPVGVMTFTIRFKASAINRLSLR